ncbi:MAG: Gfo/Idh/MocA family oxidoreductase [Actinomycetota bacterium]|nr:Gfo/Idh/MocA family oxidoreductase [Actinomycetota bacterium]
MTAKVLRVGIAGYGVVGKRRGDCVERHPNLKLVAVCDRVFTSDGVLPSGVAHFRTYQQLLQQDLDVLIVCMTNDIAAEVTIAGLNLGLHVFCEKPPGRDMSDITNVILAEKKNLQCRLMYGFNHRYHDSVQDALKIIRSGRYGNIINMRGVYGKSKLITFNQADWRAKREIAGGGVLLDQGIHMVDLMRLIAGEFVDVQSYISNGHWGYNVEDNAYALMRTEQGVVAMLNSSATQWRHQFSLDINMQRGGVILRGILTGSKSYGSETMTLVTADPDRDNGDPKEELFEYNDDPSWDREIAEFTQSVINNEPVQSGTSQDAYQTMKLVYKIYYADPIWRDQFKIENPEVE